MSYSHSACLPIRIWQDVLSSFGMRTNAEIAVDEKVKIVDAIVMVLEYGKIVP
jgi:hypothetical protein